MPLTVIQWAGSGASPEGGSSDLMITISTYLQHGSPLYMLLYFLLIVGFTYFYVAITFNPEEVADNMKKYGGFIPGIRAGRPTAEARGEVRKPQSRRGSFDPGPDVERVQC